MSTPDPLFTEASTLAATLSRRLRDLREYQLPRLRDCRDVGLQGEIAAEMREDLGLVHRNVEDFTELAHEQDTPADREGFLARSEAFNAEAQDIRHLYRKALLHSAHQIQEHHLQHSTSLSARKSTQDPSVYELNEEDSRRDDDDPLQAKTNEVTDALRRTVGTMKQELERSVMATQMLDESTQTLKSTSSLYDRSSSLLTSSSHLLTQLSRADFYDKLIIFLALAVFLLVILFIVKRRVLDKVGKGVGWWVGGSWKVLTGRGRRRVRVNVETGEVGKKIAKGASETIQAATKAISTAVQSIPSVTEAINAATQATVPAAAVSGDAPGRPHVEL